MKDKQAHFGMTPGSALSQSGRGFFPPFDRQDDRSKEIPPFGWDDNRCIAISTLSWDGEKNKEIPRRTRDDTRDNKEERKP